MLYLLIPKMPDEPNFFGTYQRTFQSSQGPIDVAARMRSEGKDVFLDEISVFPRNAERLELGMREVLQILRNQLANDFRGQGYERLIINGLRISGGNPGRLTGDIIVRLQ